MLTISQLATYAGVTVRAVRYYHQIGLLPEPERDRSGYRRYDAIAVARLIRIRTLAEAGVPLTRVQELLHANPEEFAQAAEEIDKMLRDEIRRLQQNRRRIARLAAGDHLALPQVVIDYLNALRAAGAPDTAVDAEREAWLLIAARWPDKITTLMAEKMRQLEDERTVRLYKLLVVDAADDDVLTEAADLMSELSEEADANGEHDRFHEEFSDAIFFTLLDSYALDIHPAGQRLQQLMAERGWQGWTQTKRIPAKELNISPRRRRA